MEPAFSDTTLVELILGIPGAKETVRVTGDIRYRRLVGRRVQYGIEFNADRTPHFDQVRAVIAKYVWTLFQEMLRSRAA